MEFGKSAANSLDSKPVVIFQSEPKSEQSSTAGQMDNIYLALSLTLWKSLFLSHTIPTLPAQQSGQPGVSVLPKAWTWLVAGPLYLFSHNHLKNLHEVLIVQHVRSWKAFKGVWGLFCHFVCCNVDNSCFIKNRFSTASYSLSVLRVSLLRSTNAAHFQGF